MDFRIADTFTNSLAHLTGDGQKLAKSTAIGSHIDSANPSMSFHKLDKAMDDNLWSVRMSNEIRIMVHKRQAGLIPDQRTTPTSSSPPTPEPPATAASANARQCARCV